jgi:phosphoenolpyruvate synthase/pyruvate phosphate dikinase
MNYVRLLQDLRSKDLSLAGGKGANLGELIQAGMLVPSGFVLTTDGYRRCVPQISLPELDIVDLHSLERKPRIFKIRSKLSPFQRTSSWNLRMHTEGAAVQ